MNQIVNGFTDKTVAGKVRTEEIVAINHHTARRGEVIGRVQVIEARQGAADRIYPGRAGSHRDIHARIGRCGVGIAANILVR